MATETGGHFVNISDEEKINSASSKRMKIRGKRKKTKTVFKNLILYFSVFGMFWHVVASVRMAVFH